MDSTSSAKTSMNFSAPKPRSGTHARTSRCILKLPSRSMAGRRSLSSKLPTYTPPSPFTPFLRRFTDERARDLSETIALYNEVRAAHLASAWAKEDAVDRFNDFVAGCVGEIVELPDSQTIGAALDR